MYHILPLKFLALMFVLTSNSISMTSLDLAQCKGVPPSLMSLEDNCLGYIVIISFTHRELEEDAAWIGKTLSADPAMLTSAPAHLVFKIKLIVDD